MEIAVIRLCVKLRRDKSTTPKIPRPRRRVNLGKRATVAPGQFAPVREDDEDQQYIE